jgi:hypothetical protein
MNQYNESYREDLYMSIGVIIKDVLLWINKARTKEKTYIRVSVWWKTN